MKKNILLFISLMTAMAALLSSCGGQPTAAPLPSAAVVSPDEVITEGRLKPIQAANLSFQARGIVEQVFVKAGDRVSEGDVLVRLANAGAAEAQLVIAQNAYDALLRNESGDRARLWQAYMDAQVVRAQAEQEWDDLNVDDIEDRIEDLEADAEDRREDLQDAQDEFDKYKDLSENNPRRTTAEDDLEQAQKDLNEAIRALEEETRKRDAVKAAYDAALAAEAEAKYQYEISLDGPNAEQLALAKANLDAAKDALANYVIAAPFDGVVADVQVRAGEQVGPETRIVSIADFSSWIVETTDVTELEIVKLSVGQNATIVPDALPDLELSGVVTEISSAFTQQGGDILYTVRIRVNDPDPRLKWGMTVEAAFLKSE
jgi:multidrug resistance efflux pump